MDKCPITVEPIHSLVDFNLETDCRKFKPLFLPQCPHAAKSTTYNMPHPEGFQCQNDLQDESPHHCNQTLSFSQHLCLQAYAKFPAISLLGQKFCKQVENYV